MSGNMPAFGERKPLAVLKDVKRLVVKVGTSTLTYATGKTNIRRMHKLVSVLSDLVNSGVQVVLVTSGAIGVGVGKLGLQARPEDTPGRQAAAAVGQCELMFMYDKLFGEYGHTVAQLLMTKSDVENPERRANLSNAFEKLLEQNLELHVVDGVILPNLKMGGKEERCTFLNEAGRCSIHPFRPGICRLFPLGRYYEDGAFRYFLQTAECRKQNRSKIRVKKWIDTPDIRENEKFLLNWHFFCTGLQKAVQQGQDGEKAKAALARK